MADIQPITAPQQVTTSSGNVTMTVQSTKLMPDDNLTTAAI